VPAARIVVLASGEGTLLQALLDSPLAPGIVAVGSDVPGCRALTRAESASVPTFAVPVGANREDWDGELADRLQSLDPDWVVCAGFMRIVGERVLDRFAGRIVNSHPSLLPAFPGAHAVRSSLEYGVRVSGCTVHLVDAGVDTGPILAQQPVFVEPHDDDASLHERIKQVERVLLVDVLERLIDGGVTVTGRSVEFR